MKRSLMLGGLSAFLLEVPYIYSAYAVPVIDPEPTQSVRVCDAMGTGFFQIPGSETCLQINGSVGYDITVGKDVYTGERRETLDQAPSASLGLDARSELELGVLRSYIGFDLSDSEDDDGGVTFTDGFVELGGLTVGASSSQFDSWLGSAGNVLSDDVIPYAGGMTNQINYTADFGEGSSLMLGAEMGANDEKSGSDEEEEGEDAHDYTINGYMPHLVGGLKLERSWGTIGAVAGYDSVIEEVAAKLRLDIQLGDTVSAFVMSGYQSDAEKPNYFGAWKGTYAAWSGVSVRLSPKATLNSQAAYEDSGTYALAFNLEYEAVPGFIVTPELNYTSFGSEASNPDDALAGVISIQREF